MRLADVVGQGASARILMRLAERSRLPHALLLEGPPGCGRRTLARALSQALLCELPQAGDACGTCTSCRLCAAGNHPDVVELPDDHDAISDGWRALYRSAEGREPGADVLTGKTLPVCWIREAVADRASESAQYGRGRCFIIPSAERLYGGGANALLKVLEEPPSGVRFLLTTANAALVLGTIRSRSRLIRLHPLTSAEVARVLTAGGIDPDLAEARAAMASGSHRGLWEEQKPPPIDAMLSLVCQGWSSAAVATVIDALPKGGGDEGGQSSAGEQRKALRHWLLALCQRLRGDFRTEPANARLAAERILRIQSLIADLHRNLPPRLVIETLASAGQATR